MNRTDRMFEQASGAGRQAPAWKRKLFLLLGGCVAMSLVLAGCAGMPTAESLTPPVALMQEAAKCVAAEAEKAAKQKPAETYSFKDEQNMLTAKAIDGMVAISTKFADSNQQGTHQCFAVVKVWMEQRGASERQVVAMYTSITNAAGVALQWGVGGWAIGHVVGKIGGGQGIDMSNSSGSTINYTNTSTKTGNLGESASVQSYGTQPVQPPTIVQPEVVHPEVVQPTIVEPPAP